MDKVIWKLLIVDDSPEARTEVRRLLLTDLERSYQFVEADTGAAAVRLCLEADCVLLAYCLPDMDAPEVLAAMRRGRANTPCPVLVLTDSVGRSRAADVLRAGGMDYLGRTWMNAESLTHAVQSAVERYELQRRTAVSHEVARLLAAAQSLDEILPRLIRQLTEDLGWDAGIFWMPDAQGEVLRGRAAWFREGAALDPFAAALRHATFARSCGLPGQIWADGGRPAWLADLARDEGFDRRATASQAGLRSVLAFACHLSGESLGVIEIFSRALRQRDDGLMELVSGIGAQIGQYIERTRIQTVFRESEERLRLLSDNLPDSAVYQYIRERDGSSRFLYFSAAVERLCGVRAQDILEDPSVLYRHVPPADLARVARAEAESARTLADFEAEVPLHHPDGRVRWMRLRSRPRPLDGGRILWDGVQTDITEHRLVEQRLRNRDTHLRIAFEAARAIAFEWDIVQDRVFRLQSTEDALPETNGVPDRFASVVKAVHPEDQEAFKERVRLALESRNGQYQSLHRIRRTDGVVRWLDELGRVEFDKDHRPVRLIGIAVDVTERMMTEERLLVVEAEQLDREQRYRLVVEASNDVIWDWSLTTGLIDWSDRLQTLFGHEPRRIDRSIQFWEAQIHPEDRPRILHRLSTLLEGSGDLWREEYRFRRADGTYAAIFDRGRVVRDANGEVVRLVGAMMDLTDQKRAEREAREREHRLRLAMEASATGMWDWEVTTGQVTWSPECYVIHGVQPGDFDGTAAGFDRLLHPDDRARIWSEVRAAVEKNEKYASEFRIVRPGGEIRWVTNLGRAVYDEQGSAQRMIGTITDITERKQIEEALREADRRKDVFLATLSHELRSPLAPLRTAIDVLRLTGSTDPTTVRACNMIGRQVAQMVRLVDDLLDISRVSRGKIQLQKVPLDLTYVVHQAVEMSQPLIDSRRHSLHVSLPGAPLWVLGDAVRLAQVISNLLNNAAKYTDTGGQISLSLEQEVREQAPAAVIRVRDSGRGMDPVALRSLFSLFYQVERNLDRAEGGLGIGLSLVKSLVQLHGGQVTAHSAGLGQGSEFVVSLPLHLEHEGTEQSERPGPSLAAASALQILLVDDNRDAAESMALLLQRDGHEVALAHDGDEAVELALSRHPDVVLLDIGLPKRNGYEVCRALRAGGLTRSLIVAMTGYGQQEDRRLAQEAGFDEHQVKPVELQSLRTIFGRRIAQA